MEEQTFEKLAADAAAGLHADQEVYRDVTQELHTFLEDKVERYRREGHSDEESVALAKKAFGSPLDVAAELLNANRGRLRLRALLRIGFNALIIPLAILFALYVSYGRVARVQSIFGVWYHNSVKLPTLPFFGSKGQTWNSTTTMRQLAGMPSNASVIHDYWETHRSEPDSYKFYAYYAVFASGDGAEYPREMLQGELIEPNNALYNVLLAEYYLERGMQAKSETNKKDDDDVILDRRAFDLGLIEMQKAVKKPYLHTYQMEIERLRINELPRPLLTEDYLGHVAITAAILFPHFARYRNLARKIPACARLLNKERRTKEAEAVMDTGVPYARLLAGDANFTLIGGLNASGMAGIVTREGAEFYEKIGQQTKAERTQVLYTEVRALNRNWKASGNNPAYQMMLKQHGSQFTSIMTPIFGGVAPTERELVPNRMHEHVLADEIGLGGLQVLFALLLLGTVLQGMIWHNRLRGAASVPLLLLPPAPVLARVLWWGVAVPLLIYWLYSRLPVIGGREYSWGFLWWRFGAELLLLGFLLLWLPARMINRYVRRRCEDLDISMPPVCEEAAVSRKLRGTVIGALVLTAIIMLLPADRTPLLLKFVGMLLATALVVAGVRYAAARRSDYGLYFGTLARSMAPLYAFAIILLTLTAQPLLLYQEAFWLRRDTVMFGDYAHKSSEPIFCTRLEGRATQVYTQRLLQVLDSK